MICMFHIKLVISFSFSVILAVPRQEMLFKVSAFAFVLLVVYDLLLCMACMYHLLVI